MPDGQEKSDDLIAELAKLMASNAGSSEPEAKPAPRLVTLSDEPKPAAAAPTPIRIPGMDAPVVPPAPTAAPVPSQPAPTSPGVLRIPGMDQPVPARPATVASAPAPTPTLAAPVASAPPKPAASFDFGPPPATATSFKPEPMSNWQDREIPKPVASRPAPVSTEPPRSASAPAPSVPPLGETEAQLSPAPATAVSRAESGTASRPVVGVPAPVSAPMVAAAQAAPAADDFDFDFGFSSEPPAPIPAPEPKLAAKAPQPSATASAPPTSPKPASVSGDPIADLIAAELDAADEEAAGSHADEPRPAQPAPRSFPLPGLQPAPRPQAANAPLPRGSAPQIAVAKADDRFSVAPVFGPTSKVPPQRPQAVAERDPMDEIESLIGEAVRVELTSDKPTSGAAAVTAAAPPASQPAPVVPPLTTGFAPRRAAIKDTEPQVHSAEAAILAAAAAGGAEVGRIDGVAAEQRPYKRVKAKPERRSAGMRQYVGMAVAGTLLLAAGFGLYWVLGMGRTNDAEAPVLQADATPVKEAPPPATAAPTNQGSVVFNELDGKAPDAAADEQLVSRDDSEATSVADVAQTVGAESDTGAASESELANRKVRTVTVRPDGTIVSGDEAVAGNEELPVDRPTVPDLPGADVQPSELLAAVPAGDTVPEPTSGTDTATVAAVTPTEPAATIDPTIVAPTPAARPTDRSILGGGANQRTASAPAATASQPVDLVAPAATGGSGPYVQLSSQPSAADAQASLRATQNRLSGLLAGRSLAVRQVDLGAKGTWYRVVLPVDSFQEATQTCASLKANGVDCVPIGG